MTKHLQCSMSWSWAVVAFSAILTLSGCGRAVQNRGQLFPGDPFAMVSYDDGYHDDGYYEEPFYDDFGFDDASHGQPIYADDPHGYDCFECGPGHPGPIRGLLHDLLHHRGPIARTVQAVLCHDCGQHVDSCACQGGGPVHGHGGYGFLEKPPIPVDNSVGPCWGYYQTAWRRFAPHCPNVPVPIEPHHPVELFPEEIGPGVGDTSESPPAGPALSPGDLPSPTNGDGFQAANPNRRKDWQTARQDNPLRDDAAQTRTAWKPPARMSWLRLRTADERNWRKPNEDGSVIR